MNMTELACSLINVLKGNRALLLLFSNKSSDYGAATVAKLSLYSTCTLVFVSVVFTSLSIVCYFLFFNWFIYPCEFCSFFTFQGRVSEDH